MRPPRARTMRTPKWVRWSHRQVVLLPLESLDALQPSLFQPPCPPSGDTHTLQREAGGPSPALERRHLLFMLKSQNMQSGSDETCQGRTKEPLRITNHHLSPRVPDPYRLRDVSHLDLHRNRQVSDGQVPHAARHHVAVQEAVVLLALGPDTTAG